MFRAVGYTSHASATDAAVEKIGDDRERKSMALPVSAEVVNITGSHAKPTTTISYQVEKINTSEEEDPPRLQTRISITPPVPCSRDG